MNWRLIAVLVLLLALCSGALWQPYNPDAIDMVTRHAGLSWDHLMGTDHLGRDLFSRMLVAGWRTALVIITVGAIGLLGGSLIGTMAAILGGWRELLLLRMAETFIVVPTLIVALTAAAIFGLSPLSAGLALGLANIGPYTLLSHSLTRRALGLPYSDAARALGVSDFTLMARHILPGTMPVLLTYVGSQAGACAVAYASLAFIGLGADPSKPDWGSMLFEYRVFLFDYPGLVLFPGCALAITAGLLNVLFDRDSHAAVRNARVADYLPSNRETR